jgi:phytol kinase
MSLFFAGFCKIKLNWKTGYTRKLFHFLIFITAFFYQTYFQLQGVFILGWSVTIVLIYACVKGNGNLFYEALAREKDEPHRTKYIVYSYLATFFGGVISNLLFGKFALFGYAVTGIADAIAEPIGTRFGKHKYRVFSFDKNKITHRSIEGSLSVFAVSFIVPFFMLHYFDSAYVINYYLLFTAAVICMLTEAVSPSGFDNLLLQVTASFLFCLIVGFQL